MNKYSLVPFGEAVPDLKVEAAVGRRSNALAISYVLAGNLSKVAIPAAASNPSRQDRLWEGTCFEFFVAVKGSPGYWEFNLAPSGHWNVYRLESYRTGRRAEMSFTALPFTVHRQPDSLSLGLETSLDKIVKAAEPVQVAITAVIKRQDNTTTYWALAHRGKEPDFHLRESFIVEL